MGSKPPCVKDGKPCQTRFPGCQDHCKEMYDWQTERQAAREKERALSDTSAGWRTRYIKKRIKENRHMGGGRKI